MRVCKKVDSGVLAWIATPCPARLAMTEKKANASRNDRETPKAENVICKKVDRIKTPAKDSRIFDEFCVLREKAQGSYLSGNDRRAFLTLAQKSQKAESKS